MFPDAMESVSDVPNAGNARIIVEAPDSELNSWMLLRSSLYEYNGKTFDIMRLIGQPISPNSPLWKEAGSFVPVSYETNWKLVSETFFNIVVESIFSDVAPITVSILSAISDLYSSLQTSNEIKMSKVLFYWQCATTVSFSYVILTGQPDEMMELTHISSKCETELAYTISTPYIKQGDNVLTPNL